MFYVFDDSRKKRTKKNKQGYSSFSLRAGEACEMRGSEIKTDEMKNSNGNKHGEKETETKGVWVTSH